VRGPDAPSWRRLLLEITCQPRVESGQG
jgi:hypothetical protein